MMEDDLQAGEDGLYCVAFLNNLRLPETRVCQELSRYGHVVSVSTGRVEQGKPAWCFVRFANPEEAVRAISGMRDSPHLCETKFVKYIQSDYRVGGRGHPRSGSRKPPYRPDSSGVSPMVREDTARPESEELSKHEVYVGNWPVDLDKSSVLGLFHKFDINAIDVRLYTKENHSFAFVVVSSAEDVERAIKGMNGGKVAGQVIKVSSAKRRTGGNDTNNTPTASDGNSADGSGEKGVSQPRMPQDSPHQQRDRNVRQRLGVGSGRGSNRSAERSPADGRRPLPGQRASSADGRYGSPADGPMPALVLPGPPPLVLPGPGPSGPPNGAPYPPERAPGAGLRDDYVLEYERLDGPPRPRDDIPSSRYPGPDYRGDHSADFRSDRAAALRREGRPGAGGREPQSLMRPLLSDGVFRGPRGPEPFGGPPGEEAFRGPREEQFRGPRKEQFRGPPGEQPFRGPCQEQFRAPPGEEPSRGPREEQFRDPPGEEPFRGSRQEQFGRGPGEETFRGPRENHFRGAPRGEPFGGRMEERPLGVGRGMAPFPMRGRDGPGPSRGPTRRSFDMRGEPEAAYEEPPPFAKRARFGAGGGEFEPGRGLAAARGPAAGRPLAPGVDVPGGTGNRAGAISERIKSTLRAPTEVVVANFPVGTNEHELMDMFVKYEPLTVRIMVNNSSQHPDDFTYAYLTVASRIAADEAVMEMDGLMFRGRPLVVETKKK